MAAIACRAYVLDFEGDELFHPNGEGWHRTLITEETAKELLEHLKWELDG